MIPLVCEIILVEQNPLIWGQVVWEIYSSGLTIPDSVSEKITQVEHFPLLQRQLVWETEFVCFVYLGLNSQSNR